MRKPVPGKALLPVLEPPTSPSPHPLTPTPPTGQPPSDISRPTRMYDSIYLRVADQLVLFIYLKLENSSFHHGSVAPCSKKQSWVKTYM